MVFVLFGCRTGEGTAEAAHWLARGHNGTEGRGHLTIVIQPGASIQYVNFRNLFGCCFAFYDTLHQIQGLSNIICSNLKSSQISTFLALGIG